MIRLLRGVDDRYGMYFAGLRFAVVGVWTNLGAPFHSCGWEDDRYISRHPAGSRKTDYFNDNLRGPPGRREYLRMEKMTTGFVIPPEARARCNAEKSKGPGGTHGTHSA